ncbi:MAG: protein-L-isoaspartate O-methyltransferase [Pseudomonadota bacterium]
MRNNAAQEQMINQQLRTWDVLDERVLAAVRAVPRDEFVPARYADLAYADFGVPLAHGEAMLTPKTEGRILQSLALDHDDAVLCIGAGSGYLAACMAKLAARVVAYERHVDLAAAAEEHLHRLGFAANVEWRAEPYTTETAAGMYDAIAVTGSVAAVSDNIRASLNPGGRLFIVVGAGVAQQARLVSATMDGDLRTEVLFETELAPLEGFAAKRAFEF